MIDHNIQIYNHRSTTFTQIQKFRKKLYLSRLQDPSPSCLSPTSQQRSCQAAAELPEKNPSSPLFLASAPPASAEADPFWGVDITSSG
jgi:hypothetical protein